MTDVMRGIRVLEVASWTFVPAAGAVLADWGADVLKIEHPNMPDPQRALMIAGLGGATAGAPNFMMQQTNRGKRSLAIDMRQPGGRDVLYRLVKTADVFLTNWLPDARQKLEIDVEHVRARNPNIVYVRGTGQGTRGPDALRGGYDGTSYWSRAGLSDALTPPGIDWPIAATAAIGDLPGGMTIAGGIAAALFHRERTGVAPIVDVSLLATGMWVMSPGIVVTKQTGMAEMPQPGRYESSNPISITYRTKDGRFVKLSMFESDKFFADLCQHLGRDDIADDPRFADHASRAANSEACVRALDDAFGSYTLAELHERFDTLKGAWAPVQKVSDLHHDPQAIANGYLQEAPLGVDSESITLVTNPVQFDEEPSTFERGCPTHGEHTTEILLELGLTWEEIGELSATDAVR
jgi:crotonobetainyl-CoA:carnitine CoA-transferase CaiB-like acyl-CoA transferase